MPPSTIRAQFAAITIEPGVYRYDGEYEYTLTSLIAAAAADDVWEMMSLIEEGYDVDFYIEGNLFYHTALHWAVQNDSLAATRLLLAKGADMTIQNENDGATPFSLAVSLGHLELVRYMIDKGADVNDVSSELESPPIVCGAARGQYDCVKLLLEKGADINLTTRDNESALYFAEDHGHVHLASALVSWGAK